jgi:ubiquinone/menaquinone biosynthesis C-methylase UbiE
MNEHASPHARRKLVGGAGVHFVEAEAEALPLAHGSVDRVVCFSVWPHFADPSRVACELWRVLRPGGIVHVLHVDSRATINRIHGTAGGAVARDALPPATELAALLADHGLAATETVDAADRYLVTARRRDGLA